MDLVENNASGYKIRKFTLACTPQGSLKVLVYGLSTHDDHIRRALSESLKRKLARLLLRVPKRTPILISGQYDDSIGSIKVQHVIVNNVPYFEEEDLAPHAAKVITAFKIRAKRVKSSMPTLIQISETGKIQEINAEDEI